MTRETSLLDDVLKRTANKRSGFKSWYARLPQEARDELDIVKAGFDNERHQKRAYASAIIEAATERGWAVGSVEAVVAWLNQNG